ncbi:hypothetical protein MJM43_16460, partial [Salmonella enterica subsp. enterica serovar Montevideo]|nr:hypothetical protein [Salmonella enterica subsp. enterica serovar Montevideo]
MLEARDLYCERDERTLFSGLSFTVEAGEWVQVTGGNGAGKTTCQHPTDAGFNRLADRGVLFRPPGTMRRFSFGFFLLRSRFTTT